MKRRAGHCDDTLDLFIYWNLDEENIHRFLVNEMICVQEAIKAGEEYCPVPAITDGLKNCMTHVDSDYAQLQAQNEDGTRTVDKCR